MVDQRGCSKSYSGMDEIQARIQCPIDKNVSPKPKGKFYRVVVRPTVLYWVQCWLVMKSHLQIAEMRILRWMTSQEDIWGKVSVATVIDKMRKAMLRWFVHVNNRSSNALVRRSKRSTVIRLTRCKGRPSKKRRNVITQDMTHLQLNEDITLEIRQHRSRILGYKGVSRISARWLHNNENIS